MPDVIRICGSTTWAYVPLGSLTAQKAILAAEMGMAKNDDLGIRLLSESGPLFPEIIPKDQPGSLTALDMLVDDGLSLAGGDVLFLGRREGCHYDDLSDLSLSRTGVKKGIPLSPHPPSEGDAFMTLWPAERRIIPAMAKRMGRRLSVELADGQREGSRCFVLGEAADSLLSVGRSDGTGLVRLLPKISLDSWLLSLGSPSMVERASRFSVSQDGPRIVIVDGRDGRRYAGKASGEDEEVDWVRWMLSLAGLSGLLGKYELEIEDA